jgi:hypothetical protein
LLLFSFSSGRSPHSYHSDGRSAHLPLNISEFPGVPNRGRRRPRSSLYAGERTGSVAAANPGCLPTTPGAAALFASRVARPRFGPRLSREGLACNRASRPHRGGRVAGPSVCLRSLDRPGGTVPLEQRPDSSRTSSAGSPM